MRRRILSLITASALSSTFMMPFAGTIYAAESNDLTITSNETLESGKDYSYEQNVLIINSDKALMISGSSTTDRIEVASGVNADITLAGVDIDVSDIYGASALEIADDSTGNVNITLADGTTNILKGYSAGLQKKGEYRDELGTLTINGSTGNLTAIGEDGSAGIGSDYEGCSSNIVINGGVITAQSNGHGAGIGGGYRGSGSNITINGGTITAQSAGNGSGIGSGSGEVDGLEAIVSENIIISGGSVKTDSISCIPTLDGITPVYPTILNIGKTFSEADVCINKGHAKTYLSHSDTDNNLYFYLPVGYSYAEYNGESYSATVLAKNNNEFIKNNISDNKRELMISCTDSGDSLCYYEDYTYSDQTGVLTIKSDKPVTISGKTKKERIVVDSGVNANITLDNVDIDVSEIYSVSAFQIADNSEGNVTINIADGTTNHLKGYSAGLRKQGEYSDVIGTLTIEGHTGRLTVTGEDGGAGIGGAYGGSSSNIIINGGIITATSTGHGAGIGGGYKGRGSHISINGGTVTAIGSDTGNGIGAGTPDIMRSLRIRAMAQDDNIIISGGSVKTNSIGSTPTSDGNTPVYRVTLDTGNVFDNVDVNLNNSEEKTYSSHPDEDTNLYFYLPEGNAKAVYNGVRYKADVTADNQAKFVREYAEIISITPLITDSIALRYEAIVSDEVTTTPTMVFTFEGNTYQVEGEKTGTVGRYNKYVFVFSNILPQQMNKNISAELMVGKEVYASLKNYSVITYALKMLGNTDNKPLQDLLASMVYYCEATMLYCNDTTDLPTKLLPVEFLRKLTDEEWKDITLPESSILSVTDTNDVDAIKWKSTVLELDNTVAIGLYFDISDEYYNKLCSDNSNQFEITRGGSVYKVKLSDCTIYSRSEGITTCYLSIKGIRPTEYNTSVSVVLKNGDDEISETLTNSVMSYILSSKSSDDTDAETLGVIHALYDYGNAAEAYNKLLQQ